MDFLLRRIRIGFPARGVIPGRFSPSVLAVLLAGTIAFGFSGHSLHGQAVATASLTPGQCRTSATSEIEYHFDITSVPATAFAIRFSWPVADAVVKSVEKNSELLWVLNAEGPSPQSKVAAWSYSPLSNQINIQTFSGDLAVNDRLVVRILFQSRASAGVDTLAGYAGPHAQRLIICSGNPILEVIP